jgi:hypothetical protein
MKGRMKTATLFTYFYMREELEDRHHHTGIQIGSSNMLQLYGGSKLMMQLRNRPLLQTLWHISKRAAVTGWFSEGLPAKKFPATPAS